MQVVLNVIGDMYGGYGCVEVFGTTGRAGARFDDTFSAFKQHLLASVAYLRTGVRPVPWEQTLEQMQLIIAALRSRDEGRRVVRLDEIGP